LKFVGVKGEPTSWIGSLYQLCEALPLWGRFVDGNYVASSRGDFFISRRVFVQSMFVQSSTNKQPPPKSPRQDTDRIENGFDPSGLTTAETESEIAYGANYSGLGLGFLEKHASEVVKFPFFIQ